MMMHPFIWTASGKKFNAQNIHPDMIDLRSIASGLSKECRFAGQIGSFYSVARHSLNLRECLKGILPRHMWIYPLLHDASEAYLKDIPKPLKVLMPEYQLQEARVSHAVWARFDLLNDAVPLAVKEYDTRIVLDEAIQLFDSKPNWVDDFANQGIHPIGIEIKPSTWEQDYSEFMLTARLDFHAHILGDKS